MNGALAEAAAASAPQVAGALAVHALDAAAEPRWDAFVEAQPEATFFHYAGWRHVIHDVLGHACHYLYAERDGRIVAILPLAEIRSRLFGHALISTPFCVYGGVIASDEAAAQALLDAARARAERLRVDYLELRNRAPLGGSWPVKHLYVSFRKPISADDDVNLKAVPRKQRAMIRKGIKEGLVASADDDVATFYEVYSESVRNLGTPVLPRRYYAALKQQFGARCSITTVRHGEQAIAAVMSFRFRDVVHPYYGGGTHAARTLAGNDFLYWSVMQQAAAAGASVFDFGRSKEGTGSYHFKKHWGFEPEPLPYAYHLVRARDIPDISPLNRKYQLFIAAWKHLPLPVSRIVGPWLARSLG